jgi:hypothetical protein
MNVLRLANDARGLPRAAGADAKLRSPPRAPASVSRPNLPFGFAIPMIG